MIADDRSGLPARLRSHPARAAETLYLRLAVAVCLLTSPVFNVLANDADAEKEYTRERERMAAEQIVARGIHDPRVLKAMRRVKRHQFVPEALRSRAYGDHPLPIGEGQTISQPYIVALMTEVIQPKPDMKVLEIGTGSGYQAAVLAELCGRVYTIEIIETLGRRAGQVLAGLYENVQVKIGDGYQG